MISFKPHTHPEVVNASVLFYRKGNESREDRKQTQIHTSSTVSAYANPDFSDSQSLCSQPLLYVYQKHTIADYYIKVSEIEWQNVKPHIQNDIAL